MNQDSGNKALFIAFLLNVQFVRQKQTTKFTFFLSHIVELPVVHRQAKTQPQNKSQYSASN